MFQNTESHKKHTLTIVSRLAPAFNNPVLTYIVKDCISNFIKFQSCKIIDWSGCNQSPENIKRAQNWPVWSVFFTRIFTLITGVTDNFWHVCSYLECAAQWFPLAFILGSLRNDSFIFCANVNMSVDVGFRILVVGFCGLLCFSRVLAELFFLDYLSSSGWTVAYFLRYLEASSCRHVRVLLFNNHPQFFNCRQYAHGEPGKEFRLRI